MTVYANRLREFQTLRIMRFGHSSGHYEDVYRSIGSVNIICLQDFIFVGQGRGNSGHSITIIARFVCVTRNVHFFWIAAIRDIIGDFEDF